MGFGFTSGYQAEADLGLGTNGFEVSLNYITGVPDPNTLQSTELQLLFRGLQKHDSITREKSIAKLFDQISHNPSIIKNDIAIISWCQMYPMLGIDESRKVRTFSHKVQSQYVRILQKKFSKYLRDTIGVWLSGLFDADRSTSKLCKQDLYATFNNDQAKLDGLWKIFTDQITNYVFQVITLESQDTLSDERFIDKDESRAKYHRVLLSTILLFSDLLSRIRSESINVTKDTKTKILSLFTNSAYLPIFSTNDPLLKKAIYQTIRLFLSANENGEFAADSNYFDKLSSAAVKGLKINKKQNPALYSGSILAILDALTVLTKRKSAFWLTARKAEPYLLDTLRLGSLGSNPLYYDIVYTLLTSLPYDFLPIKNYDKVKLYLGILETDVENEKLPGFKVNAFKTYMNFMHKVYSALEDDSQTLLINRVACLLVKILDSPRHLSNGMLALMKNLKVYQNEDADIMLDINSAILDALPSGFIEYASLKYKIVHQKQFCQNFISLLQENESDLLLELITNSVESLRDETEEYPTLALDIIDIYIKMNINQVKNIIANSIPLIDSFITKGNPELVFGILLDYWNSNLFDSLSVSKAVDAEFISLQETKSESLVLNNLSHIKDFQVEDAPNIKEYLLEHTARDKQTEENDEALFKFLNPEILEKLYVQSVLHSNTPSFVRKCEEYYQDIPMITFSTSNNEFLVYLIKTQESESSKKLLDLLLKHINEDLFMHAYLDALKVAFSESPGDSLIRSNLDVLDVETLSKYIPKSLVSEIEELIPRSPTTELTVSNIFGTSLYLFSDSQESLEFKNLKKLNELLFYAEVLRGKADLLLSNFDLATDVMLLLEIISDCSFLSSEPYNAHNTFQRFRDEYLDGFFNSCSLESIFAKDLIVQGHCQYLEKLLESKNNCIQFYTYRVYARVASFVYDKSPSRLGISDASLKFIASDQRRMTVLLLCDRDIIQSDKLFTYRNRIAASIIGIRSTEDILGSGLKSLLLINLMLSSKFIDSKPLFPPQRFMMMLNTLTAWLDCDISYDTEFTAVRIALLEFATYYLINAQDINVSVLPQETKDRVSELIMRVCTESLDMLVADKQPVELSYFTLRLVKTFFAKCDETVLSEYQEDIQKGVVEYLFNLLDIQNANGPLLMVLDILTFLLNNHVPLKLFQPKYANLFEYLVSPVVKIQRLSVSMICKLLPQVQDKLVVDTSLDKELIKDVKIPQTLIDRAYDFSDSDTLTYLWNWYLILKHFPSITQELKDRYIEQLSEGLIYNSLALLVDYIDVGTFKFPEGSSFEYVSNYSVDLDGDSLDKKSEKRKLEVNLLYMMMRFIGGSVVRKWFSSIRDIQLKNRLNTFIATYISPILIDDILDSLSLRDVTEDDKFKLKVNKTVHEVTCSCEIDDQTMEILISLPADYPLSQISVRGLSRVGIKEKRWQAWIRSFQYMINFQNMSIMDAVKHFKENVDSKFAGYEDCAICYSIINAVDHSTPNKVCPTCHHNFHSACLYRWFKSSGQSTCPLCRSSFSFKKHH